MSNQHCVNVLCLPSRLYFEKAFIPTLLNLISFPTDGDININIYYISGVAIKVIAGSDPLCLVYVTVYDMCHGTKQQHDVAFVRVTGRVAMC